MTSRDSILQRVRNEVAKGPHVERPAVPEVWPRENLQPAAMAERFIQELTDVHGEVIRCASMDEASKKLRELAEAAQWTSLGAMDRPMVRDVTAGLPAKSIVWAKPDWQPTAMAELSASVIEAEVLPADTGSSVIDCRTTEDRLLCYLPPACVIVARVDQLVEHLPAAWPSIVAKAADPNARGELVIVTGPSRTADIEKILILGVHGPKRLVVLLVG